MSKGSSEHNKLTEFINLVVEKTIKENSDLFESYQGEEDRLMHLLMPYCMKLTKGKANPKMVESTLLEGIERMRMSNINKLTQIEKC